MKQLLIIVFAFSISINLLGQNLGKGIYVGYGLPFTICYLTYSDSIIEVEYFYKKSVQIFGHSNPKAMNYGMESFSTKSIFVSKEDSIKVYLKSDHYLIKRKGREKIKVYKSTDTQVDIRILRNRNKLFSFSNKLHRKYTEHPDFDNHLSWKELNKYNLESKTSQSEEQFQKELSEVEIKMKAFYKKNI
jgi:hypothetical protein